MVLLTSSATVLVAANKKVFRKGELHITRRCESESVLILMERGVLHFREDGVPVALTSGEYYIQRPGLLQEGVAVPPEADDPAQYFYVHFVGGDYAAEGTGVRLRGTYRAAAVAPFVEMLLHPRKANRFRQNAALCLILAALADGSPAYDSAKDLTEAVRCHLESDFAAPITVPALARRYGYHPDHLTRLFRARYGTTIHRYLTDLRVERARWLLRSTSSTVAEIAAMVGYRDPSAFYRAYTARYGEPPRVLAGES